MQGEKGFHFLDLYVQGALDLLIEYCSLAAENPESLPDLLKFLNIIIVSLHDLAIEQEEICRKICNCNNRGLSCK